MLACTAARQFSSSAFAMSKVNNVTVIGAGLMGSGIAQVTANASMNVTLVDQSHEILEKAKKGIDTSLRRVAKKKFADDAKAADASVSTTMSRVHVSTNVADAVRDADLVIEAIVENIDIKRKLFSVIEQNSKSSTILTSNTSSLRLVDIGRDLTRKNQFGGLHFFNPVPLMKLLEVVRHPETNEPTYDTLMDYGRKIGKTTVSCKDTPGFIVNRLLVPYLFEAVRMVERNEASAKDVDTAMKLGAGHPMGPFELADYVGLDTCKFIMDGWHKQYPKEPMFKPSPAIDKLVSEGKLGRKSGEGFFKY